LFLLALVASYECCPPITPPQESRLLSYTAWPARADRECPQCGLRFASAYGASARIKTLPPSAKTSIHGGSRASYGRTFDGRMKRGGCKTGGSVHSTWNAYALRNRQRARNSSAAIWSRRNGSKLWGRSQFSLCLCPLSAHHELPPRSIPRLAHKIIDADLLGI